MAHLDLNHLTPIALVGLLGVLAVRVLFKALKVGLLISAPALLYLLHHH